MYNSQFVSDLLCGFLCERFFICHIESEVSTVLTHIGKIVDENNLLNQMIW